MYRTGPLSGRDTEQSGLTLGALKASRAKTDEAYLSLVRRVNAHAEIEGAGDYFAFITYVNEQIKRFKEQVLPSGKGSGKGTGSGKGSPEYWVAVVKPGRVLFEMDGVARDVPAEAMRLAGHKLPIKTKFVVKEELEGGEVNEG